jgi:hypothetical protein
VEFFRLIKPNWAQPKLKNGNANPEFVREIGGPDVIEGYKFDHAFLKQRNDQGYNIYWYPNHPSKDIYAEGTKWLSGKHVDVFDFLFVDMDLKDKVYASKEDFLVKLRQFPLKPTFVVDSGNGVHAYWQIDKLTRDEHVFGQLALIKHFNTDESIFTVQQLMRVPGFFNTKKPDALVLAQILEAESCGQIYSLDQFPKELFAALTREDINRGQKHLDRLDGKLQTIAQEFVNIDEIPDTFFDFIADPANKIAHDLWMDPVGSYGDRSGADMKLANILFKSKFNRKEALAVIANTKKALSHANRKHYAEVTVDKVYNEKLVSKFLTVGQRNRTIDDIKNLGAPVRSTWYFDYAVLGNPWRKRELTGLIAGTGVGKTTVTLKWVKDAIENNQDNDDIYVFFTLEMAVGEIVDRWNKLVGKASPLADRLYVVGNETENFEPRNVGLQEILEDCEELKRLTGKNIGIVAIDHVAIVARHIDCRKKYTFGIDSEQGAGYGNIKTLSLNSLCSQLKVLCKKLDTHIIVLTQTTKEKGVGDLPIDKDGAYGMSNYENIMDRIITVWQPLKLVQAQAKKWYLAWQYVKIRNKHENDQIRTHEAKLLTYNMATGDLTVTEPDDYQEFLRLYPLANEIRKNLAKKEGGIGYSIQVDAAQAEIVRARLGLVKPGSSDEVGKVQSN